MADTELKGPPRRRGLGRGGSVLTLFAGEQVDNHYCEAHWYLVLFIWLSVHTRAVLSPRVPSREACCSWGILLSFDLQYRGLIYVVRYSGVAVVIRCKTSIYCLYDF